MANEAVLVFETHPAIQMTVANATGIEKGAVLTLSDPLTAALCTASTAASAGIAKVEKIASDGITTLAVYRGGVFKVTASGSVTVGESIHCDGNNKFSPMVVAQKHRDGYALESATNGETFLMELQPGHVVQA